MNLVAIERAAGLTAPIRHQLFIDGRYLDARSGETLATLNPHDNSTIAEVALAGKADVDLAVAAAERAHPAWARLAAGAHRVARDLRAGMVWINSYKRVHPGSPFGGVGLSGYGREMGFEAMREYTRVKSVWVNVDAQSSPWYPRG